MPAHPSRSRPTVLLVEDDEDIRELARMTLEQRGFEVLVAADAASAIVICGGHDGPIDVLLTDLGLPGVSGGELARSAAGMRPSMGIVYVSGVPRDIAVSSGLIKSTALLVSKPFTAEVLANAVRSVVAR